MRALRDRGGRRAQRADGRPARVGQDDARPSTADHSAAARRRASGSRPRSCTRSRASIERPRSRACGRFALRTTRRRSPGSSAAERPRGRARPRSRTTACCSSTRCPSSDRRRCSACGSRWRTAHHARASRGARRVSRAVRAGRRGEPLPVRLPRRSGAKRARCPPSAIDRYRGRSAVRSWTASTSSSRSTALDPARLLEATRGTQLGASCARRCSRRGSALARRGTADARARQGAELLDACGSTAQQSQSSRAAPPDTSTFGPRESRGCCGSRAPSPISTGATRVGADHIAEALGYRSRDGL